MWNQKIQLYQSMTNSVDCIRMYIRFVLDCIFLTLYSIIFAYPSAAVQSINPFKWKSLKEEIILVTGASGEIGRQICLRLGKMEKCCTIICWDVDHNSSLVEELRSLGVKKVASYRLDVSDSDQVKAAADKIKKDVGDVTILINNAGVGGETTPLWKQSSEQIERMLAVNLKSHIWTLKEFIPSMIKKNKGHIVTNCSIFGLVQSKKASIYATAMHGVQGCIESVKQDVLSCQANIHFTTVYPATHLEPISLKSKYPFLMPKLEPEKVAERIIHGMRRHETSLYIPFQSRLSVILKNILLPTIFQKTLDVIDYDVVSLNNEPDPNSRYYC